MDDIAISVAIGKNRVIGINGKLPWHLPADLKRFRRLTSGNIVVMGKATFFSIVKRIGTPLPNRTNVVLSRSIEHLDGVKVFDSFEKFLKKFSGVDKKIFVIGGESIYKVTLPFVDKIFLTIIHEEFDGDSFFPELTESEWQEIERIDLSKDNNNPHNYSFIVLKRRKVVDVTHAKTTKYREILQDIREAGKCPFCLENFKWHDGKILKENGEWFFIRNAYSYKEARDAFLIICKEHKESIGELTPQDWMSISFLIEWAKKEFDISGAGIAMRFGDTSYTGATVCHLHFHLLVPEIDTKTGKTKIIWFPFG